MRKFIVLLAATSLSACGGAGPNSAGSVATTGGTTTTSTTSGTTGATTGGTTGGSTTTTSTATGGSGSGITVGASTNATTSTTSTFLGVSSAKDFDAIGSLQSLAINTSGAVLYQGNASTVKTPSGKVNYDPRDGIFTLTLADTKSSVNQTIRFQDPAHRTVYSTTQWGTPNLSTFNYLESLGTAEDVISFFYQRPGTSTNYVSLAGYVRNPLSTSTANPLTYERGAMVFGEKTLQAQIPLTGTASYTGGYLATMITNPNTGRSSYYQWIAGSSSVNVDFGRSTFSLAVNGTVGDADFQGTIVTNGVAVASGSTFAASGSGNIDLLRTGGFTGTFSSAAFTSAAGAVTAIDFAPVSANSATAGASSIDGTFFGPNALNVGGNTRIIGGIPNQRVDINGAFTGSRPGN